MTDLRERFDGGVNGANLASNNTLFPSYNKGTGAGAVFTTASPIQGTADALFTTGTTAATCFATFIEAAGSARAYLTITGRFDTLPAAITDVGALFSSASSKVTVRINPAGTVTLRIGTTNVATTTATIAAGTAYRADLRYDAPTQTVTLKVWNGAATAVTETLTSTGVIATTDTVDRCRVGVTSTMANGTVRIGHAYWSTDRPHPMRGRAAAWGGPTSSTPVYVDMPTTPPPPAVGTMQAVSSDALYQSFGVAQHPDFGAAGNVHAGSTRQTVIMGYYDEAKIGLSRGNWNQNTRDLAPMLATHTGTRWVMQVVTEGEVEIGTDAAFDTLISTTIPARIAEIGASDLAPLVAYIEGANEPNHLRGANRAVTAAEWDVIKVRTVRVQRAISDGLAATPALAHVKRMSTALHDTALEESGGTHLTDLGAVVYSGQTLDIRNYVDFGNGHSYPAALSAPTNLAGRLAMLRAFYGSKPIIMSEAAGYTNAVNAATGSKVISEELAGYYMERAIFELWRAGLDGWLSYEMMDDPDAGKSNVQFNYGHIGVTSDDPATWTRKPSFLAIKKVLAILKDATAGSVAPGLVPVEVTPPAGAVIGSMVTRKRDGSATLWLWQDKELQKQTSGVWSNLTVPDVTVTVRDLAQTRPIVVGKGVVAVPLATSAGPAPPAPSNALPASLPATL